MTHLDKLVKIAIVLSLNISLLLVVGCTKYASQEDAAKLEEVRQAAVSAEKELDQVFQEAQQLEKDLSQKESELADAKTELENIKTR